MQIGLLDIVKTYILHTFEFTMRYSHIQIHKYSNISKTIANLAKLILFLESAALNSL